MGTRITRQQAREAHGFVKKTAKEGFKTDGAPSAVEEACRRFNAANPDRRLSRRAFRERYLAALDHYGLKAPQSATKKKAEAPKPTAQEHAHARAVSLAGEITSLVTRSKFPLINPQDIRVESYLTQRYNRSTGKMELREGTPRTWMTGTLYAEPILRPRNKRFIFMGAQNDAPVHKALWGNLNAYGHHKGAQLVAGPWTYETQWWAENNPTSRSYDSVLSEHLCFGQMAIGDHFVFCGEMNTLPTANRPVSDLVTYTRGRWGVFPHAKVQLKTVPSTDPNVQAHQIMTTGAITVPKVIPRKAGVKSIFHHVLGATIVEFDSEGRVFCRQLNAAGDGSFYDLDCFAQNGRVTTGHRLKALAIGDLHRAKLGPVNCAAIFGVDLKTGERINRSNLIDALSPEMIFLHDIFDNQARNHHHEKDHAYQYEMAWRGRDSVFDEVKDCAQFLRWIKRNRMKIVVVESNHDIALDRYVNEGRYRMDGKNTRFGLQLNDALLAYRERVGAALEAHKPVPTFSLLEHAIRKIDPRLDHVKWTYDGKSFPVGPVEYGHHGFRGANGAKGTVAGFARMDRKMTILDKHTPEIMDAVYVGGDCENQHGYNKGPSGWAVAHVAHYQNDKRSIITMQGPNFRG